MNKQLFLEDLKGFSEEEVKAHLARGYGGDKNGFDYGEPDANDQAAVAKTLEDYTMLVAYESVGDYGCDSSSYFLMQNKETGEYMEFSGGHCSCYGFEGQFDPEPATLEYLKSERFNFYCGGYDDNETENQRAVKEFIANL